MSYKIINSIIKAMENGEMNLAAEVHILAKNKLQ